MIGWRNRDNRVGRHLKHRGQGQQDTHGGPTVLRLEDRRADTAMQLVMKQIVTVRRVDHDDGAGGGRPVRRHLSNKGLV